MRFFLDNCLSTRLAQALDCLTCNKSEVVHLRAKFGEAVEDEVWIPALGAEEDWIVVSGDYRIIRNPALRRIWSEAGLCTFFFADGYPSLERWEQFHRAVKWWPEIERRAKKKGRSPTSYKVRMHGQFEVLGVKPKTRGKRTKKA